MRTAITTMKTAKKIIVNVLWFALSLVISIQPSGAVFKSQIKNRQNLCDFAQIFLMADINNKLAEIHY
jgi:hypothetical protein